MGSLALALLFLVDARRLFEQGVAQQRAGDLKAAEASFVAASQADPKQFAVFGNLGVVRAQFGDFAGALDAYRRALQLNPQAHRLHLNIGIAHFKMSQFALAVEALAHVSDEPQAEELLALSLFQIEHYEKSEGILRKLIASHGEKLAYLYALGQAQIKQGKPAAGKTFERMFSLYPNAPETALLRA